MFLQLQSQTFNTAAQPADYAGFLLRKLPQSFFNASSWFFQLQIIFTTL